MEKYKKENKDDIGNENVEEHTNVVDGYIFTIEIFFFFFFER